MAYYGFNCPSDWANCRNIDERVNLDEINQFNIDNVEDDASDDGKPEPKKEAESPTK